MLDINKLKVASPCGVPWEAMTGDDRRRMCGQCNLHVHNIAGLTAPEVEELIAKRDGPICVRLHRRADGTVITRDCPVGLRAYQKRITRYAVAAFASVLSLFSVSYGQKDDKIAGPPQTKYSKNTPGDFVIRGNVVDPNDAVVPGAKIKLFVEGKKKPFKSMSDSEGRYEFSKLDAGVYKFVIELQGFKKSIYEDVVIGKEKVKELKLMLEPGTISVTVGLLLD